MAKHDTVADHYRYNFWHESRNQQLLNFSSQVANILLSWKVWLTAFSKALGWPESKLCTSLEVPCSHHLITFLLMGSRTKVHCMCLPKGGCDLQTYDQSTELLDSQPSSHLLSPHSSAPFPFHLGLKRNISFSHWKNIPVSSNELQKMELKGILVQGDTFHQLGGPGRKRYAKDKPVCLELAMGHHQTKQWSALKTQRWWRSLHLCHLLFFQML